MPYRWALSLIVEGVQTYERFCDVAPPANCGGRRAPQDLRQPARVGETARAAFAFRALRLAQRKTCSAERHRSAQAERCQAFTPTPDRRGRPGRGHLLTRIRHPDHADAAA